MDLFQLLPYAPYLGLALKVGWLRDDVLGLVLGSACRSRAL